jgi:CO/xanthine dehydrogenase Mo-binding subunit
VEAAFAASDLVIEREFRTKTVHQGYIELHACTALAKSDGQITIWTATQGHFPAREQIATILKVPLSRVKVVPMEIGGGFGGKIPVYVEPVAALLSIKSGKPVRIVMTRAEVFQASGPTSSTFSRIKIGVDKQGRIKGATAWMAYEAGAFPGDWSNRSVLCVFSPYKLPALRIDSHDVMTNTTKVAAYRAPASPQAMWGVESVMDEIAQKLGIDPLELRMRNAVQEGDQRSDGLPYPKVGLKEVITAAMNSPHYKSPEPKGPYQGRGLSLGFWFNAGLQSSAMVTINMDGTANVVTGSVDIGGSRASMAMITAETLGLAAEDVRPSVADTESIGHTDVTGGSRVTHTTGMAVHDAAQDALRQMRERVAKLWDCQPEKVSFSDGAFRHSDDAQKPITVKDLAPKLPRTGGPVVGRATVMPKTVVGSFSCHIADVEIDPETGKTHILRYTALQDVGTAIHPSYVEGQIQGGAMQGIGWALNEEYVRNDKGEMLNAGFLDYRMPTFLDAPQIEVVMVEVFNPNHPYGVRGVGETPIVPPLAALHNAIAHATGERIRELPLSPPRVYAAIEAHRQPMAADD